jgi:drug/metabolite transporter (DMT)-like permease
MKDETDFMASATCADFISILFLCLAIFLFNSSVASQYEFTFDLENILSTNFNFFSLSLPVFVLPIFTSILYFFHIYFTFKGSQSTDACIRTIVAQTQGIWTVIFCATLLGEVFSLTKLFAFFLIITGSVFALFKSDKKISISIGVIEILLASFFSGIVVVFDKLSIQFFAILVYALILYVIPPFIFVILMGKNACNRIIFFIRKNLVKTCLLAFFGTLSFVCMLLAFQNFEVSTTRIMLNSNIILTTIGAMIFLNEKDNWQLKILGAILAFFGSILLFW